MVSGGTWTTYQGDVYHSGYSPANFDPATLTKAWQAPDGYSIPLVVGDTVYSMNNQNGFSDPPTTVSSFNLADGSVNWTYTNQFLFPSYPSYAEGLLAFTARPYSGGNTQLYVLNAATGALKYSVPISSIGSTDKAIPTLYRNPSSGKLVAYVADTSKIYAVNLGASSGSVLWSSIGNDFGHSIPTVIGNSVVLANSAEYYAFDQISGAQNHFNTGPGNGGGGTTVVADSAANRVYILESYSASVPAALTAYAYADNSSLTKLWQVTGAGIENGASVALGKTGLIYSASANTLREIDPVTGSTLRLLTGLNLAAPLTPAVSDGYIWLYSSSNTLVYDLQTLQLIKSLPGSRGPLLTAFDGPGAISDQHFLLEFGTLNAGPGFAVYAAVPEPETAVLALSSLVAFGCYLARRASAKR